jgi:hypothetical protein
MLNFTTLSTVYMHFHLSEKLGWIKLVMSIQWMGKENLVSYLKVVLKEVKYEDDQKKMVELCKNRS